MSEHLFSIAPDGKFLDVLADRVLDGTLLGGWPREGPFWLADVTIVLPTRRARLALAETFMRKLGGAALLPDIRTFGGEQKDEEPFLPPLDAPALPGVMAPQERQLALAQLVDAWARTPEGAEVLANPPNAAEVLALAGSLGDVIDDLAIEGVSYSDVRNLPPESLAANWQRALKFLDIALEYWPQHLAGQGIADAVEVRNLKLRRQAAAAPALFGDRPVIAAGSTGSIPATADLLKAIMLLPRGVLVVPGLDTSLTPAEHEKLINEDAAPHGHPQYGLAKLMRRLGTGPAAFVELSPTASPRTSVVRQALALANSTAWWAPARADLAAVMPAAIEGLSTIAARTADEEARAVALCARAALSEGRTVGIVSPDQNLARRIAVELKRFGVEVDDPAGTPLYQSPAGRLARLLLGVAVNRYAAVDLVAVLRSPAVTFGLPRPDLARLIDRLELCLLRGQRLRPGIAGLRTALTANAEARGPKLSLSETGEATLLFDRLEAALAPIRDLLDKSAFTVAAISAAIVAAFDAAVADTPPPGADVLRDWATGLSGHSEAGPALSPHGLDNVLRVLMDGHSVRNRIRRREDIFIWGQLEARLQNPDLMILAGLNEDVWPRTADPGPWLSRGMRLALKLEPPERRQGQAAHDFEMAIGNRLAVIAFAERLGTAPALPSRLVQRLEAFIGEALSAELRRRGAVWIAEARAIDAVTDVRPAPRPMPRPPAEARPRKLSVTEIETLFRSPYDVYAKHVLGLRKLAPLGEEPDARERGIMVHDVFARFVEEKLDVEAPDAFARLKAFAVEAFAGLDAIDKRRDIWLRRFEAAAAQFLEHERARNAGITRHAEIDGKWELPNGFTLTGRADRIDFLADGSAEIIDFKTGSVPGTGDMLEFLAPQLPLEAAMLEAGAFENLPPAQTSALTFIKIGLGPSAFVPIRFRTRSGYMEAAAEASQRLQSLVDALLLRDTLPMTSQVLPYVGRRYRGDYDHLARVDEWAINEGDESE